MMENFIYVGSGSRFSSDCGGSIANICRNKNDVPVAVACTCGILVYHLVVYNVDEVDSYFVLSNTRFTEEEVLLFQKEKSTLDETILTL